jgi:predicted type IV restriction endonuclease
MNYESSKENLEEVSKYYEDNKGDRNEATTRLHLIDKILFECLDWREDDCESEERKNEQYTDYTLSTVKRALVVEAKREGKYFELPTGYSNDTYKISSLCSDCEPIEGAIKQAMEYCQQRGVKIGAVSNGHQLVAFIAVRSDGVSPMEGRALVYESFEDMKKRFKQLWNCLSKEGVSEENIVTKLTGVKENTAPPKLSSSIAHYPGTKDRNPFQTSISVLSEIVFKDIPESEDAEEKFLRECYCESGALSQYAEVSKKILSARYDSFTDPNEEEKFDEDTPKPDLQHAVDKEGNIATTVEGMGKRPILLVGDVGVGKQCS